MAGVAALAAAVMLTPALRAQTGAPAPVPTVARCAALRDSAMRGTGAQSPPDFGALLHVVKPCVERIIIDSLPSDQLVAFADLARTTNDMRRAGEAIDRRLADTRLSPQERLDALRVALQIYSAIDPTLARPMAIARDIDALGPSAVADRLASHTMVLEVASRLGRPVDVRAEAMRVLDVAALPDVRGSLVSQRTGSVGEATLMLADLLVEQQRAAEARALLDSMPARFPDLPGVRPLFAATSARYAMIGAPAPMLRADAWLAGDTLTSWRGKVHVLEFTAHWCAPCRLSYPALAAIEQRHGASAVGIVLATRTYGYYGRDTAVAPSDEIERDRAMYARELPVPAAIAVLRGPAHVVDAWVDANQQAFRARALPFFVVIDRAGIVRDLWAGWSPNAAARLERDVAAALASSAPSR